MTSYFSRPGNRIAGNVAGSRVGQNIGGNNLRQHNERLTGTEVAAIHSSTVAMALEACDVVVELPAAEQPVVQDIETENL